MANNELSQLNSSGPLGITGDVIGGAILALLGLFHLFILEIDGIVGGILLLFIWPLLAGAFGTYLDSRGVSNGRDLRVVGPVVGVFGSVTTVIVLFLTGWAGLWSGFIYDTLGVDLVTVTFGAAILLTLMWTISAFIGGYLVTRFST